MADEIRELAKVRQESRPVLDHKIVEFGTIDAEKKSAMYKLFFSGRFSISEVAKRVGVSYSTAKRCVESDEKLHEAWESAFQANMDGVEEAMITRAIDGRNEIAAQQAGEFLLRHHRRKEYDDNAVAADAIASLPKIIIPLVINRQPKAIDGIAVSKSPLE